MKKSRFPGAAWRAPGNIVRGSLRSLLELVYPEHCALCGAGRDERPWCEAGARIAGLTWYDEPHLCAECATDLEPAVVQGALPQSGVPVFAGRPTGPELVTVLSQWKYHGVRGLAWPLVPLIRAAVSAAVTQCGPVNLLVPVALHGRRQRQRGFNQAAVLAQLGSAEAGGRVRVDLLRRTRSTGQQAKLNTEEARLANVAGAFAARSGPEPGRGRRVGVVDDLVTGGTTCEAAVSALRARGWDVCWVVAAGLAGGQTLDIPESGAKSDRQVDTAPVEF